ncbi:hypothetical protein OHC33_007029 [Knufia fluminis]|uniref:Uncharacterized protein n=1 Tax=Knufia fluminis TaxID=191047 RepID=A0AAN8I2Q6_9EURO|nr:hypothetical protein OHC33_007029 [Knufia fluminis]
MWQRWGNKQPAISQPTLFTQLDRDDGYGDYDDRYLETIPEVDSTSSRRQSAHIGLPELPFRAVPPMTEIPQPVNVYSQPSPPPMSRDAGLRINVDVESQTPADDVSPLTPQTSQQHPLDRQQEERPVSPIEPVVPAYARGPLPERPFQSQIPRKVSKPEESDGKAQTKWDDYSGEPINDNRGIPASVRPGTQTVEMQYPHLKERTKQILAGIREIEGAKKKPWGKAPPPVADDPLDNPPQRAPWRGASGRAALVEPVKNTPSARQGPILHPARKPVQHTNRNTSQTQTYHDVVTDMSSPAPSPAVQSLRTVEFQDSIKPIVPLKTRSLTPPMTSNTLLQSPTEYNALDSAEEPQFTTPSTNERSQGRVESPQYEEEPTTPTTPMASAEPPIHNPTNADQSFVQPDMDREQSHFSWTTYTTSVADSPRSLAQVIRGSSPPHPLSDLPAPITIKKRPVSTSPFMNSPPYMHQQCADSTGSVVRKPVPNLQPRTSSISSAISRAMSTSKTLPPTPTTTEAAGKIESLDAQLESLNRRKHNTTRIINDLEAALKKNAVVYDMWKRKEVEKNIANHKMALDDIGSEIHEISLQLHRAQRKRDRDDGYEACTGLWIKRVTS